jgi:type IV secretory pathway VirB2 component (pilin)
MLSRIIPIAVAMFFFSIGAALAAAAGGGGAMPWDAPLTAIQQDLSGVTATSLSLIAIVVVFGVLIFGGELNHFARMLCFVVMCVAVLVAGNGLLGQLGIAGAEVDSDFGYDLYGFVSGIITASLIWAFGIFLRRRWLAAQPQVKPVTTAGALR